MKKIYKILGMLVITCVLCICYGNRTGLAAAKESDNLNVLIINSYHQGFVWTKEETDGIIEGFKNCGKNVNIDVEYMDWKKHADKRNLEYLYQYYKYKYKSETINLILATDDAALQFSLKYRKELFSNAPVIFCGVNKEGAESITKGQDKVTGVIEIIDPAKTIELAYHINPNLKNIYLLYDNTESGISTGQLIMDHIKSKNYGANVIPLNQMTFDQVIHTVGQLKEDSVVIIATYSSDINNHVLDMNYVIREVSTHSSVPVYHLYDFSLNSGVIGGGLLSGKKQGEYAAQLALRVIDGEDPDRIAFFIPDSMRLAVDFNQLGRYHIPINKIPANYEIINKPFSFYKTYKPIILCTAAVIAGLLLFIYLLLYYIRRMRRIKKELSESHEELTQLYEELAASDEEMKQQYDEILSINEKIRSGEEKLTYLAYHDTSTGLPNKLSLYEASKWIFRPEKGISALLYIDIDNFKNVNDTLGHEYGDLLVKKVGERLISILSEETLLYRLGGDEFIMLLQNIINTEEALQITNKLLAGFSTEFDMEGSQLQISLSIGVAMYPEHGEDIDQLLKYADIAMYRVKATGKKNYILYDKTLNDLFLEQVNIEKCMPRALERGEFELYYQPQVNMKTNKITGFEALLRWHSSDFGEISPLKFIKIAEDSRFIIPLGKWVLENACSFMKRVHDMGYSDLVISVNISIIQLLQQDFCDLIYETLEQCGLDSKYLELEITESILMESIERISSDLKCLYESNIKIALDDFGKGYSSLNYLKQLPISTLKLDKTFIDSILNDKGDTLTGQIISIGKSMGMSTVAEGVETMEQFNYLLQYECDKMQGYLFSKPQPEADILRLLYNS